MAPITLYFLQASRSIRVAWILEELGLDYENKFYWRESNKAPASFKADSGNPLGKAPTLRDGGAVVYESGAIIEYLAANYDKDHRLIPDSNDPRYPDVLQWVHAAEGAILLHALAITYATWQSPQSIKDSPEFPKLIQGLSVNVQKDFDWLDNELAKNPGGFLVGDRLTAADIMVQFSARFTLTRELGTQGKTWKHINAWLEKCENTPSYRKAVEKTGHSLDNGGNRPE